MAVSLPFQIVKQTLRLLASGKRENFIEACKNPEKFQAELKDRILRNSNIPFPENPTDYQNYDGKENLTLEKVKFYETTSGSTGFKKRIPYTRSLLKSFENMFLLWAHDLIFHSGIDLSHGKFFMSVSPQIGENSTDDRKYLSPSLNLLLSSFLVSNPNDHKGKTSDEFFFKVCRDLLKNRDLEVFSVWSPTYLLSLLNFMKAHKEELKLESTNWEEIWPKLKLISCWTHAQALNSALNLQNEFPNTKLQPKGLLLTEAPVSIPWSEANGNIPLVTETFLEFLDGDKILGLHEIQEGKTYLVLTSQFNGFLRYNTQDEIKVTGFYYKTPILEFLGRAGCYTDLAGEKISESMLINIFSSKSNAFLFVPDESQIIPGYRVYTESTNVMWESELNTIYHYNLGRKLHQLREVQVVPVKNLTDLYLRFYQAEGMNLGDIKEKVLIHNLTQAKRFLAWIDKEVQSSH